MFQLQTVLVGPADQLTAADPSLDARQGRVGNHPVPIQSLPLRYDPCKIGGGDTVSFQLNLDDFSCSQKQTNTEQ